VSDYPRHAVYARGGVAAGGGPLATSAAVDVLRGGGNAVDAVIAASLVQSVVEMPWGGIGGDAFVLVRSADGGITVVNGSGAAPMKLSSEVAEGEVIPRFGPLSVAVPGFMAAVGDIHASHGSSPFPELFSPAIHYADEGFAASVEFCEAARRVLPELDAGAPLRALLEASALDVGATFRQPRLAETLRELADGGATAFYGSIAERLTASLTGRGGVVTPDDFASHTTPRVEPLGVRYHDIDVYTHPPVSYGCVLLQQLKMYERLDVGYLPSTDPARIDAMVRCKHAAFADATAMLRDPSLGETGVAGLLSDERIEFWAQRLMDTPPNELRAVVADGDGSDTTCVVAADSDGNVAAMIHSLFNEFGSRELDPATGVLLNDRLANQLLSMSGVGGVAPGARPLHTLNAFLAVRDGKPVMLGATPGGRGQVQTSFQLIVNAFDGGLDPQVAIDAPRWLSGAPRRPEPNDHLYLEPSIGDDVADELRSRGHRVVRTDAGGVDLYGSAIAVGHVGDGSLFAAADDRREARTGCF
jgi:gamma-glutamyltranspeptidase/glutathione hydrolase